MSESDDSETLQDLAASLGHLAAVSTEVVSHAHSLAYLSLELVTEVRDQLVAPLAALNGRELSEAERDMALRNAINIAVGLAERVQFALTAHAGIEVGVDEMGERP